MLKTSININYTRFTKAELRIINRALRIAYTTSKSNLPKKTGRLQSCFNYEIIGDSVYLYIDSACFYAEYLLDKPKTRTYWNDCRNTFVSTFYGNII